MKRKKSHFDKDIIIKGEIYWYKGSPPGLGRQVERSLKIKVGASQKAVKKAKRELLELLGCLGSDSNKTKYEKVIKKYLRFQDEEGELAQKTLYEIKSYLGVKYDYRGKSYIGKHLGPFLKNYPVETIDQLVFEEYCQRNKDKNLRPHAKTLNAFLKWCVSRRILKIRPVIEVPKRYRKKPRKRAILTNQEIVALLNGLDGRALLYHLMYLLMGMRNSEIVKLRWSEMNLSEGWLWVNSENNRNRKEREIPINSLVIRQLEAIDPMGSDWVFPSRKGSLKPYRDPSSSFRKDWARALKEAGIKRHLTPHDMRATFEKFMHKNTAFTDTQREKMAGAKIDVQKDIYVSMRAEDLKGLEESVQIEGLKDVVEKKNQLKVGQKLGQRAASKKG